MSKSDSLKPSFVVLENDIVNREASLAAAETMLDDFIQRHEADSVLIESCISSFFDDHLGVRASQNTIVSMVVPRMVAIVPSLGGTKLYPELAKKVLAALKNGVANGSLVSARGPGGGVSRTYDVPAEEAAK